MTRNERRNSHNKTHIGVIVVLVLLVALIGGYALRSTYYAKRFLPNTVVNGVKINNLTISEANRKITRELKDSPFLIKIDNKNWKEINRADLGWQNDYLPGLKAVQKKQNPFSWGMQLVSAADTKDVDGNTLDETKLDAIGEAVRAELTQANTNRTATENAKVTRTDNGFEITPEKQGTTIDVDAAVTAFKEAAKTGKQNIDFDNYLAKPTITKDDATLKKTMDKMNAVAKIKATYSINGKEFQIPTSDINTWLIDDNGTMSLDQAKVTAYVTSLGEKYNTSSNPTEFNSTRRGKVSVPSGTYSWTINTASEVAALTEQILAGKDFTRSPIVTGATTADKALIDKTYIEVDLENQHMWYYKDGKVAIETDIVSGKPSSATPAGVDYVWSKETNKTLKGQNDDGSDYASPVKYWMPIDWTGVGIHDSDWQPAYGGDLWKTRGSHGCVNTPPDVMAKLYNTVEVGTPVLVF
ncbi:L,D-transpeptidase family protein [Enterococcus xiangfangensis]|uniref:L,D-transpeptidase family protein n=1 Tax=Enterococcus xiangfangensis TaxID=1296537 RepID=A0ABU3F8F3_9ENTE|nr:L,D-transpeptidase family protein [Enterococcus xiangfangensis]MDT2758755.1 L,D-transpeptidase family protein [Enterococcus xiangfangensis]